MLILNSFVFGLRRLSKNESLRGALELAVPVVAYTLTGLAIALVSADAGYPFGDARPMALALALSGMTFALFFAVKTKERSRKTQIALFLLIPCIIILEWTFYEYRVVAQPAVGVIFFGRICAGDEGTVADCVTEKAADWAYFMAQYGVWWYCAWILPIITGIAFGIRKRWNKWRAVAAILIIYSLFIFAVLFKFTRR